MKKPEAKHCPINWEWPLGYVGVAHGDIGLDIVVKLKVWPHGDIGSGLGEIWGEVYGEFGRWLEMTLGVAL